MFMNSAFTPEVAGPKGRAWRPQKYDRRGHARLDCWHNHPSGLAGLAFEAEFHRLRLEGSPFLPSFGGIYLDDYAIKAL